MKPIGKVFVVLFLSCFSFATYAGDAAAGKEKSLTCAACHGGKGISPVESYPNLAGQKEQYLIAQMIAFRDGARKNAQMSPMVSGLSDEDIANLAAYYASLSCN